MYRMNEESGAQPPNSRPVLEVMILCCGTVDRP